MINQQPGLLQRAPVLENFNQNENIGNVSKPNTYEEPTITEKLFKQETEDKQNDQCKSERQKSC